MATKNLEGVKIIYLGDWVFYTGPNFIESPFEMMAKDCQLQFLGKPVTDCLENAGASVRAYSNWQLYHFTPEEYQGIIDEAEIIFISDVEARCFQLSPSFFDQQMYMKKVVTFPDKLKYLVKSVEAGKGLVFLGGWLSFSGFMTKGGWGRSSVNDWLPFNCLQGDDLVESSEGFSIKVEDGNHRIVKGLSVENVPPLLGYNEFSAKSSMKILWSVKETGHPLLGISEHVKGRMVTYGSDPVPHWGMNFMLWEDYTKFWQNIASWVIGRI
jgi:uncharacterized membrane protein